MNVVGTKLPGVLLIKGEMFEDHRGCYRELYNERLYRENGVGAAFVEDDISVSTRGVLKGLHGDDRTWKLVSCLQGRFYLVVVNYVEGSEHYGQWESFVLSENNGCQVLIPPQHGNGHLCLSERSIFHYKQSEYYGTSPQFTIKWNDPRFNIWWPVREPILSRRDDFVDLQG